MSHSRSMGLGLLLWSLVAFGSGGPTLAQTKPEGEMRWALYVTLPPAWFDPAEAPPGTITPFWVLYALHDALVKPMPGNQLAPSLALSWAISADQKVYEFKLREGVKFHNGDDFTAEDVKFSFLRAKGKLLHDKVQEVEIVDPHRVRFVLKEPWPDFMTFYGTLAVAAGWIVPKKYTEAVGADGFKKHPIGAGPYKFVSSTPGIELVMEAYEGYWRKVPAVKRLIYRSVPEATTRLAMLKRGEVDLAYLLDTPMALEIKRDPTLKLAFSGGIGTYYLDFLDMWDPKSPWADQRVRLAASLAIDRKGLSEAETVGASPPTGNVVPASFEFALPLEPHPYDPAKAKKLLAEAGYPNGFEAGDLYPWPPYFSAGEAIANDLAAIGIGCARWSGRRCLPPWPPRNSRAYACASTPYTAMPPRACRRRYRARGHSPMAASRTSTSSIADRRSRVTASSARPCCTRSSACSSSACGLRRSSTMSGRAGWARAWPSPR
jgi:peptide/nickel transport system substrate-binding protein